MTPKLYSNSILVLSILTLTSCSKWLVPEDKIEGSWRLAEVERKRTFNTETITTGYESGVFIFNQNTTATYTDALGTLTGSWNMRRFTYNTTNSSGQQETQSKIAITIKLHDYPSNRFIDWVFDEVDFRNSNKKMLAKIEGIGYEYRYWFIKQ